MATSMRRAGVTAAFINGVPYDITEARYSPTQWVRETLVGLNAVHGYRENPNQGRIVITVRDAGGMTVADFNNMTDVEVQLQLANGKSVGGTGMWCTEAVDVAVAEATMEVTFEGVSLTETTT
jgi:Phage tail tube protein